MVKILEKIRGILNFNKIEKSRLYNDDTFIVSYPKSGNTWVRFILANLIYGADAQINFHTAKDFIPELGVHDKEVRKLKRPRLLKSHSSFNPEFNKVIYIIRDVRDVYISYYHYLKKKYPKDKSIDEFIIDIDLKKGNWSEHVIGWITNHPEEFLLIRYEDLLENTVKEVEKMVEFLNLSYTHDEIKKAVENSSLNKMKEIEKKFGRPFLTEKDKLNSTPFVRKGEKKQWSSELSQQTINFLNERHQKLLKQFHYL